MTKRLPRTQGPPTRYPKLERAPAPKWTGPEFVARLAMLNRSGVIDIDRNGNRIKP